MSTTAPTPPSKNLLLATGIAGGFTLAAWATIILGIATFNSIPPQRQIFYLLLGLTTAAITGILTIRCVIARERFARAQAAEWEAKRVRRADQLLDGEEDRALWDSVPATGVDADTCGIDANVVALSRYRFSQAG